MKKKFILLLLILACLPLFDLLQKGIPHGHDTIDHVARIANFYRALSEGVIVPRWAGFLNWGYGHPILMFLYPLPSYLGSLFHVLGFSFSDSIKLVFAVSFVGSIMAMYLWLRQFLSEKAAIVGGLLYGYAPYHFVDLYVRGAIGELAAFVFPPLVLYFFYKLSEKSRYRYVFGGSVTFAGFILAHNAVSLMFLPVILLYCLYLFFQTKQRKHFIQNTLLVFSFGFILPAFFWIPGFLEGKYTLRDIVTQGSVQNNFVMPIQLLYGPWDYGGTGKFTVQVGIVQWLGVLLSIVALIRLFHKKSREWYLLAGALVIFLGSLFVMLPVSTVIWDHVTVLQKFQFPWRFLSVTIFASALLGAFAFDRLVKKGQTVVMFVVIVLLGATTFQMWHAQDYIKKPDAFFTGIYHGTTDTGESAPIWSVRFMENEPDNVIEFISGDGNIYPKIYRSNYHEYEIVTKERVQIRENTLYFPGWEVTIDGRPVAVEFQDANNRGVMTFFVEPGTHTVRVAFTETKLRLAADSLSIVGLVILLVLGILRKRLWRK